MREFGFPWVSELIKEFKWKKMNFTTMLPKHSPQTTYLVATGTKPGECFWMHVVVLSDEYSRDHSLDDVAVLKK